MSKFKSIVFSLLLSTFTLCTIKAETAKEFSYTPEIHGVFRARWEMQPNSGQQHFQVRNARLTIGGKVHPSISYFLQTDLCDKGEMKILDAYGRFDIIKDLYFQAGQFRMPFGVEPFRAPADYIFATRSFLGNQIMNYRAVGIKAGYTIPKTGLTLEAGAFNPNDIKKHDVWTKRIAYSAKATLKLPEGFSLSTSYGSIRPASLRANLVDAALSWQNRHLLVAAEYMHETYCNSAHKPTDAYCAYIDWNKPIKLGCFNRWSIQGRYDGMTDHIDMKSLSNEPKRQRATIGSTLTLSHKSVHADLRLNYEKAFYYKEPKEGGYSPDRLIAEMVIRF